MNHANVFTSDELIASLHNDISKSQKVRSVDHSQDPNFGYDIIERPNPGYVPDTPQNRNIDQGFMPIESLPENPGYAARQNAKYIREHGPFGNYGGGTSKFNVEPMDAPIDPFILDLRRAQEVFNTYKPVYSNDNKMLGYQTPQGQNVGLNRPYGEGSLEMALANALYGYGGDPGSFTVPQVRIAPTPSQMTPKGVQYRTPSGVSSQNPFAGVDFRQNVIDRTNEFNKNWQRYDPYRNPGNLDYWAGGDPFSIKLPQYINSTKRKNAVDLPDDQPWV